MRWLHTAIGTLAVGASLAIAHAPIQGPQSLVGKPAPKLTTQNWANTSGQALSLAKLKGKVVVLDFWATWCPPCREGTPQLVRIANQNRARGVEVIGMHIDDQGRSSPDDIRKFMNQYNIPYRVGLATDEMFVAYLGTEETAIPQTLVFDRSGRAIAHFIGYTQSHARALDEAVNRAIAGS